MGVTVTGFLELESALAGLPLRLHEASAVGLEMGAEIVVGEMHRLLNRKSHPPGTPTPSRPGEPPARISGDLSGSVHHEGPEPEGPWEQRILVGADTPYARVQELGGRVGRGAVLPARPYTRPAVETAGAGVVEAVVEMWAAVLEEL